MRSGNFSPFRMGGIPIRVCHGKRIPVLEDMMFFRDHPHLVEHGRFRLTESNGDFLLSRCKSSEQFPYGGIGVPLQQLIILLPSGDSHYGCRARIEVNKEVAMGVFLPVDPEVPFLSESL